MKGLPPTPPRTGCFGIEMLLPSDGTTVMSTWASSVKVCVPFALFVKVIFVPRPPSARPPSIVMYGPGELLHPLSLLVAVALTICVNGRVTWRAVRASPRDPKQALGFYSRVSVPDPGRVTSKVSSTNRHHRGVVEDDTRTTTVFRTSFSERDVAVIERPSYCSFSNAKHVVAGICGTLVRLGQPPRSFRHA